jgi:hypothetical protein
MRLGLRSVVIWRLLARREAAVLPAAAEYHCVPCTAVRAGAPHERVECVA